MEKPTPDSSNGAREAKDLLSKGGVQFDSAYRSEFLNAAKKLQIDLIALDKFAGFIARAFADATLGDVVQVGYRNTIALLIGVDEVRGGTFVYHTTKKTTTRLEKLRYDYVTNGLVTDLEDHAT